MYLNNICTASFMTITAEKIAVGWADHFLPVASHTKHRRSQGSRLRLRITSTLLRSLSFLLTRHVHFLTFNTADVLLFTLGISV